MTRSLRQHAILSGICFALLTTSISSNEASAQAPPEAIKNYEKAKQAYSNGDFELAVDYLQRAYAEDPDLIYQYNRIRALQAMKSYDEALEVIDLFRGPMSRDPDQRFSDLDELEAQIREEQAQFKAAQQNQNTTAPGDTKTGNDGDKTTGNTGGDKTVVTPPPDVVEDEDPNKKKRTIGWVLAGAGAASILGSAPFWSGLLLKNDPCYDKNSQACNDSRVGMESLSARRDRFDAKRRTHQIVGAAGLGVGAALMIPGVILILKNPKPDRAKETSLRIQPVLGPDQAGAVFTIRF